MAQKSTSSAICVYFAGLLDANIAYRVRKFELHVRLTSKVKLFNRISGFAQNLSLLENILPQNA